MATPYVQSTGRGRGKGKGKGQSQRTMQQLAVEGAQRPMMLPMVSGRAGGIPPQAGVPPMGVSAPRGE